MGWLSKALLALLVAIATANGQSSIEAPRPAGARLSDAILKRYFSQEELGAYLDEYASRCAAIARKFSIGKSVAGQELWALEIADRPGRAELEPSYRYVGNMHGDEPSGRQLLLQLAEWLCSNNGKDARATRMVKDMHLFIMPTMNPDGFAKRQRNNGDNVDLNRDFPDPIRHKGTDLRVPRGTEQPEVLAMMNWTLATRFTAGSNLHEGAVVANYPYDGYPDGDLQARGDTNPTPDDPTFRYLATVYAKNHTWMATARNREFANAGGITNGAQWYPLYGGMQDWSYVAGDCLEITLELSDDKWRRAEDLPTLWDENKDALVALPLAAALGGIRGTVKAGSQPLSAAISVKGNTRSTRSTADTGYFNRPLAPGKYTLSFSSPGYQTQEVAVEVPASGQGVELQVVLLPEGVPSTAAASPPRLPRASSLARAVASPTTATAANSSSHGFHLKRLRTSAALSSGSRTGAFIVAIHIGILGLFLTLYMCSTMRNSRRSDSKRWSPVQA